MSASHRKISRLPLEVFENLDFHKTPPETLRSSISSRLKRFPVVKNSGSRNNNTNSASVKTIGDLLRTSKRTLLNALDPLLTYVEIEQFLERTCRQCAPKPVSALSLLHSTTEDLSTSTFDARNDSSKQRMRYLPTGLTSLDRALLGGIRVGTVTELVGRAGAGKTNFALQLCVLAAKFNQGAMYIDTEKKLVLQRLHEISRERFKNKQQHEQMKRPLGAEDFHDQQENNHDSSNKNANMMLDQEQCTTHQPELFPFKRPQDVLTNLTVKTPGSTEELIHVLEEQAEMEILQRNHSPSHFPVRLLVVDSIAAPLKRDFGSDSAPQRAAAVFGIAQTLKRLADQLHLAVVVLNQVGIVDNNNNNNNSKNASWGERGGNSTRDHDISVRAALGTSWHHCVSTRLLMEHQVDPHRVRDDQNWSHSHQQLQHHGQGLRHMSLVKSNAAAFSTLSFEVTAMGVVEASSSIESEHQQIQQE